MIETRQLLEILVLVCALVGAALVLLRRHLKRKYAVPASVWVSPAEPQFRDFSQPGAPATRFRVLGGVAGTCEHEDDDDKEAAALPPEDTAGEVQLSVVIPAYNEEARLPRTLEEYGAHLAARADHDTDFTYEILVVDDGSRTAGTAEAAEAYARTHSRPGRDVRVLRLARNRGKGGAVRRGVLCARGAAVLFADADGATAAPEISHLYDALRAAEAEVAKGPEGKPVEVVAIGTRPERQDEGRRVLSAGFRWLVRALCVRGVRDTQCGFKMFTRAAAGALFPRLHVERWAFDVELLYLAQRRGVALVQRDVAWHDVAGSTLSPVHAALQMARDLVRIRLLYALRVWTP